MALSDTKRKILDVSLDLFSVYGYEATSLSQIAEAVGIKKSSLYNHFSGKQAIFDALIEEMTAYYQEHSLIGKMCRNDSESGWSDMSSMTVEEIVAKVKAQVTFVVHDPVISKVRKLLVIEQFVNPELRKLEEKQSYSDIKTYFTALVRLLIAKGQLIDGDPEIMALQFISPVSMQIYRIDRDPALEDEAMQLIEKHITQFYHLYRKREKDA